mgnify:CR=1 FL=1
MKISYAITVCNELNEVTTLLNFLLDNRRPEDEIVVLFDKGKGTDKVWGSSISDLAEDCIAIDPTFDFLKSYGPILDKYLYSTRYPTFSLSGAPYEIFTKEDSDKAKELSGEVIKFCDEKLKDEQ